MVGEGVTQPMLLPVQPEALAAQCLWAVFVLEMSGVLGNGQNCPDVFPAGERGLAEFPRRGKYPS